MRELPSWLGHPCVRAHRRAPAPPCIMTAECAGFGRCRALHNGATVASLGVEYLCTSLHGHSSSSSPGVP
ncbi:hypothetical protein AURDEDRAFT_116157 [Auricularia subglabra TFB-10046 SS5]|nr:hypothetical protein AURDEDRAFT_116157 [Auricularia subglabra TFB-10046 SS5]